MGADVTGTLTVDAADGPIAADLSTADRWHALVLHRGRPVARVDLASPGRTTGDALQTAALARWADWEVTRELLVERLRARLGVAGIDPAPPPLAISVVVCTHRRPDDLGRLLGALGELDPRPHEVVVVDNDPGEHDCEAAVRAAGVRYVREDRRGLDNARNAGIAAARGTIVAFIDDDCVPSRGWLGRLPIELANPAVVGVTGPAFPHTLDTAARRRMERQGSLARGLRRIEFDWLSFAVADAGAIGVGANMAFRRAALLALGPQPFPPELDAGTATESGGDTYVMAKLLARGHRLVYDPATFVYHRHRRDPVALHRAFFGYGVGLGAALAKLTVDDKELSAPATWLWLLSQYRSTQQRRLAGLADAVETRLAWDFVRGGVRGPLRWRRALREAAAQERARARGDAPAEAPAADPASVAVASAASDPASAASSAAAPPAAASAGPADPGSPPAISVIVPTSARPASLARCLDALARQDAPRGRFEVVVVDDAPTRAADLDPRHAAQLELRAIRAGGRGAAAARNAGARAATAPLLLFLDDDVIAEPGLVRAHLARHERECDADAIVVGPYLPAPLDTSLAASAAALWWDDLFHALARAGSHTYLGVLTGNMSIGAVAFARTGGFDERFGRTRREDWEWGYRALRAGLSPRYEPSARGRHEFRLDAPGRLRAAELEGRGDVHMLTAHPDAGCALLPLVGDGLHAGGRTRGAQRVLWRSAPLRRAALMLLAALERMRLRRTWVRAFNAAQRLSYERGVLAAAPAPPRPSEPLVDVDLDGDGPIARPTLAPPTLRVRVGGQIVAHVQPALGQWTPALAEQLVDAVPWQLLDAAAGACGCRPVRAEAHDHASRTLVVFGPAHGADDVADVAELTAAGATVATAEGPAAAHWRAATACAAAADRELVAFTLPGVRASGAWLEQALAAFDGERVGVVVGCALPASAPPAPLVLHGRHADARQLRNDAVIAPWYVVLRRELLPALGGQAGERDALAPVHALVEHALDDGWVVGYRDVHGLAGAAPDARAGARSLMAVRVARSRTPAATAVEELRRATFFAARDLVRGADRRTALRSYAGTVAGLQRVWGRRGLPAG
ncbi:MAG TPA: glycosyltransferase [Conexibacter sp.]|nr:glycosyltransferase [Conexibacter sp.]